MNYKEINTKDLSVLLEAFREYCSKNPYDPTLVMTLFDRAISKLKEEKVNERVLLSLIRTAYRCRVDCDETYN